MISEYCVASWKLAVPERKTPLPGLGEGKAAFLAARGEGNHLGSTSITADASGNKVAELRYKTWGASRYTYGTTPTKRQYTGQVSEIAFKGLYFYGARFYDP